MSDQPDVGADLEYDLAHEGAVAPPPTVRPREPVQVRTETADQGEDYSYDLAHDIPPPR